MGLLDLLAHNTSASSTLPIYSSAQVTVIQQSYTVLSQKKAHVSPSLHVIENSVNVVLLFFDSLLVPL